MAPETTLCHTKNRFIDRRRDFGRVKINRGSFRGPLTRRDGPGVGMKCSSTVFTRGNFSETRSQQVPRATGEKGGPVLLKVRREADR